MCFKYTNDLYKSLISSRHPSIFYKMFERARSRYRGLHMLGLGIWPFLQKYEKPEVVGRDHYF